MKKKLIIFVGTLKAGGAERVVSILTKVLTEKFDVEIVLYYDAEVWYKISDRVKITFVERECKNKSILYKMVWLRKYVKKNANIVLSFLAPLNMFMIVTMLGSKIPVIVADRNDPRCVPTNGLMRKIRDVLYRFAYGVVLQNENNKKYFSKKVQSKSAVIFNPVDIGEYRGKHFSCDDSKQIVCVGRLIKQKNNLMLLKAFKEICDDFPDYKLVFYGDGDMKPELEQNAKDLEISDRVFFPGAVSNVFEKISCTSLFVMTSDYEGMPNALLEAMCIGLPVISTKVSGAVDVICDGENGLLVDKGDIGRLAEAMRRMLSDKSFAQKCGERAADIADMLDKQTITKQWIELIQTFDKE